MISALLGSVIMSAATIAMLVAVKVSDNSLNEAGKYPLSDEEKNILLDAGFVNSDINLINQEIDSIKFDYY